MQVGRIVGVLLALASTLLGLYGLINAKPLPLSARLGAMTSLDRNEDGRVSEAEWIGAGRPAAAMAALDTNHDGYLEPKEARRRRPRGGH